MTFVTDTIRPVPTNHHDTSRASADQLNKNKHRFHIYDFIHHNGGATCDEVETGLGLRHQTASCLIRFLTQDAFLEDSGRKRVTRSGRRAIVWKIKKIPIEPVPLIEIKKQFVLGW